METKTTASRKIIATWTDSVKVGIYDSEWTVKLYADRAVLRAPYVKWVGNSGGYAEATHRITGRQLTSLLAIAKEQVEDDEDYTERVKEIVWSVASY